MTPLEQEMRRRAIAEEQLEESRARCAALAAEKERLAAICNDLTFRCVMSDVEVPQESLLPNLESFPKELDCSPYCHNRSGCSPNFFHTEHIAPGRRVFTDATLTSLCDFGPSSSLETLSLAGSRITDAGVAQLCKGLPRLRNLSLSGCVGVSDASASQILSHMTGLQAIDVSGTKMTNEGISHIAQLGELHTLRCGGCKGVTDESLVSLSSRDTMVSIDLSDTGVTDKGVSRFILSLPSLTCISCAGCNISDPSLQAMAQLPGLQCLNISNCESITDQGLSQLQHATKLTALDLSKTPVTSASLAVISSLKNLTYLNLGKAGAPTEEPPALSPAHQGAVAKQPTLTGNFTGTFATSTASSSRTIPVEQPRVFTKATPAPNVMTRLRAVEDTATFTQPLPTVAFSHAGGHHRRVKPMQVRRSVVAGFARRNLVPCDEPDFKDYYDKNAKQNLVRKLPHPPVHPALGEPMLPTSLLGQTFNGSLESAESSPTTRQSHPPAHANSQGPRPPPKCKPRTSKNTPTFVARLQNSLEQDMTFRTMESL